MKVATFYLLVALCLIYGGLTLAEGFMYQKWERMQKEQTDLHHQLAYFQQLDGVIEHLLHDMALASQQDPAIAEMLKKRQIKVVVTPGQPSPGVPASPPHP